MATNLVHSSLSTSPVGEHNFNVYIVVLVVSRFRVALLVLSVQQPPYVQEQDWTDDIADTDDRPWNMVSRIIRLDAE